MPPLLPTAGPLLKGRRSVNADEARALLERVRAKARAMTPDPDTKEVIGAGLSALSRHVAPHRAAMSAMDSAESARRRKDRGAEKVALREALALETGAAELAPDHEPTRSVLYRSAACIAVELGDTAEAHRLARAGLRDSTPAEIRAEILSLLREDGGT